MKIWVICQYYKPEPGAPSARLSGFAKIWQSSGHDVTILTGFPNHPKGILLEGYEDKRPYFEDSVEGVRTVRHNLYITPNEGILKKTLSHLSFMWSLLWRQFFKTSIQEKPDIILVSSPSFFAVISAWLIARKKGVPFVFEVRDLWPGIFKELGTLKNPVILGTLEFIEKFLYRRAGAVVAVTNGFVHNIVQRGIPEKKVYCITNGVSDYEWEHAQDSLKNDSVNKLRSELQITPLTKVLLYIGAHGPSQALGQIIDVARFMMTRSDILFLFVGDGADKQRVMKLAQGMPNVQFLDSQPKKRVWDFYNMCYASFVPLKDIKGFDTFIPSKMFEIWATGTPVLGAVRGEAADIMMNSGASVISPPESPEKLIKAIEQIIDDPAKAEKMGVNGRKFVYNHYVHSILASRYLDIFEKTITNRHD